MSNQVPEAVEWAAVDRRRVWWSRDKLIAGSSRATVLQDKDAFDDLAVALTGMDPSSVWITRLEADLPRAALQTDFALVIGALEGES